MATAMRALIVVMLTVLAENGGQMAFGDDEHPVEAPSAYPSHPALRDRICLRGQDRGENDPGTIRPEDLVKLPGVLLVPIVDQ
jgi:hypothetical protein